MSHRLLEGPDAAVRLWWEMTSREETAGSRDPFLIKGSVAAKRCEHCGHNRHQEVPAARGRGWVDRCLRCGKPWKSRLEYVVRGTVQATRRPRGLERRLVNLGDLEWCIDQIRGADARVYGLHLITNRSFEAVARMANELAAADPDAWVGVDRNFTLDAVRWAVKRARRTLRAALEARGLIAIQLPVLMRSGAREQIEALEPLPAEAIVPADPVAWSGLLHELQVAPEVLAEVPRGSGWTLLSRGSTSNGSTIYREVSL